MKPQTAPEWIPGGRTMFFSTTQHWMIAKGAVIASSFALLNPLAFANTTCLEDRSVTQPQVAEQLDTFERTAAATRIDLDSYAASARNNNLSRQSHANNLYQARENVNLLGKQLRELETLDPQDTALQQAAIREARPHLEQLADHVHTAIVTLNAGGSTYRFQDFSQAVNGMYRHADSLYTKVDALTDFEKACRRAIDVTADKTEI
jgi:DNA repair ATPase RecN